MQKINQKYTINAPLNQVWQAFFDPSVIDKWGGGPAVMAEKENFDFSLWGGEIHGTNLKIVKHKSLVQDWFDSNIWIEPSRVTFTFRSDGDSTVVDLLQENITDASVQDIDEGWKDFYLGPIKELLEQA